MDAVKSFNAELSSLYDVKPPISKAKMTALTRGAIKAIKFYKHVVQSVEKFILKCKPEYKVPGLYVIDSIVRQSRHQFGTDKDVFAPRFAKNMQQTFVNLYKCPPEDKSKVIRVLNLWQKNQVFAPDVIQPLFDLADPNHPMHKEVTAMQNNGTTMGNTSGGNLIKGSPALQKTPTKTPSSTDPATLAQLGTIANNPYFQSTLDSNTIAQLQQLHRLLLRDGGAKPELGAQVHFDRKLLDFDYGSDEDEGPASAGITNPSPKLLANTQAMDTVGSLLSNPEVLRQLQTLQQSMSNNQQTCSAQPHAGDFDVEKMRKLQEMKQQEEEFDKHLAQTLPNLPFAAECEFKPNTNSPSIFNNFFMPTDMSQPPPGYKTSLVKDEVESEVEFVGTNDDMEVIDIDHGDSRSPSRERYGRRRRSRSRERSRDRSGRRRRSRSRSRSRTRKYRSRSRERDREREKEKEKDREKERERKKRGLPPLKKDNLSVCSTTLWVGHLSKLVHQEDLSDTFGEFGEIISIDLIIPRGCAFIVMDRRQDATRCLTKLKNHKLQGKAITLAWAPGKGVKGKDLKDYWEGDLGVSYIPYAKLRADMDLELLEDGGTIDEDTAPEWMRPKLAAMGATSLKRDGTGDDAANKSFLTLPESNTTVDTSQPPPVLNANLLPPPPPMTMPMVAPFQLNNRLLSMPPNMLQNASLGVPPPNLPGALLQNPLLGMNSFGQGLLAPPMPPGGGMDKGHDVKSRGGDLIPPPPFNLIPPHPPPILPSANMDENMDVEMEDVAEKPDKHLDHGIGGPPPPPPPPSINMSFNGGGDMMARRGGDDMMRSGGRMRSDRDREHSRDRRDRDRERDRDRDREMDDGSRPDRRWGRDSRSESRDERREREKALNDRLRKLAGDSSFREDQQAAGFRDEPPPPPPFRDDAATAFLDATPPPFLAEPQAAAPFRDEATVPPEPPQLDRPPAFPNFNGDGAGVMMEPPVFRRHIDEFHGADGMSPPRYPNFDGPYDGPPLEFDPLPPMPFDALPLDYDDYDRFGPMRGVDRFDDRRRGGGDYYLPPRDFPMRGGPRFRGGGADMFVPHGAGPMMLRPPMFRGARGQRGGPMWMDRARYDAPPDFYRGGAVAAAPGFDDPPRHRHERERSNDRRRFSGRHDDYDEPPPGAHESGGGNGSRRNRWSNGSPVRDQPASASVGDMSNDDAPPAQPEELVTEHTTSDSLEEHQPPTDDACSGGGGNTTPLHDEPAEQPEITPELPAESSTVDAVTPPGEDAT